MASRKVRNQQSVYFVIDVTIPFAAFADWSKRHPLYGKLSSAPLSPYDWWSGVIRDTFKHAGADSNGNQSPGLA